jgi:uncharacterized protein (TIGR03435 family)
MKLITLLIAFAFATMPAASQTTGQKPAFEVVSIKLTQALAGSISGIQEETGRIIGHNVTVKRCIRGAYDVPETLIVGGPKWIEEERYDIEARAPGPSRGHELMIMLQSLLTERFHLKFHREQRNVSGYALALTKSGIKAEASSKDAQARTDVSFSGGRIEAQASTMANLAQKLSDALHQPVEDSTHTEGRFNFKLSWNPQDAKPLTQAGNVSAEISAPSIFTALQEQLGLKLESAKVPVEVLVIDSAQRPSEN